MDGETEITVIVDGRSPNQALFLEDKYWGMPLRDIRDVLIAQNLSLPTQYKFLTKSKNAISTPAEEKITLKRLMDGQKMTELSSETQISDGESMEIIDKSIKLPEIHIVPVRPRRKSARGMSDETQQTDADTTFEENADFPNPLNSDETEYHDQDERNHPAGNENGGSSSQSSNTDNLNNGSRCPMAKLNRVLYSLLGTNGNMAACPLDLINWKFILKALFGLMFLLTSMLLVMVMTLYTLYTITCFMSPLDMASTMNLGGMSGIKQSDDISKLNLRMSELEMSTKFELQDMKKRLNDLEDMYLRDSKLLIADVSGVKEKVSQMSLKMDDVFNGSHQIPNQSYKNENREKGDTMKEGKAKYKAEKNKKKH